VAWVYIALLVLSPAILYGLLLVWVACYRRLCPACGHRSLNSVNFIKATVVVNGQRAPDSWSYYLCGHCAAEYKLHHGVWSGVPESERHYLARPP
jgi:hypothetical protein